jgi:ABC-type multidrug transport system ATPase subunit
MISFKNFSFNYINNIPLFKDLDFNIKKDQITVLTGFNGSGKTTFCRLIMGLLKNYNGSLKINGIEQHKLNTFQLAEKITFLKQEPTANIVASFPDEDLDIWLHKFRSQFSANSEIINDALSFFSLIDQKDQPVWELSSGQLKRIGLAALLLNLNKYWILDEPTSGLDPALIGRLIELIEKKKEQKKNGILLISHRFEKFQNIADRILEIKDKTIREIK